MPIFEDLKTFTGKLYIHFCCEVCNLSLSHEFLRCLMYILTMYNVHDYCKKMPKYSNIPIQLSVIFYLAGLMGGNDEELSMYLSYFLWWSAIIVHLKTVVVFSLLASSAARYFYVGITNKDRLVSSILSSYYFLPIFPDLP